MLLLVPSNDFVLAVGLVSASTGKWSCVRASVRGRVRDVLRPAALDAQLRLSFRWFVEWVTDLEGSPLAVPAEGRVLCQRVFSRGGSSW